jgi:TIR domain
MSDGGSFGRGLDGAGFLVSVKARGRDGESERPRVFICYSHADIALIKLLVAQLKVLETQGLISISYDQGVHPGEKWHPGIQERIDKADLALVMVSAELLVSSYIQEYEIPRILRREEVGLKMVPVLLRPCPWQVCPWLAERQIVMEPGNRALGVGAPEEVEARFAALALDVLNWLYQDPEHEPPATDALGQVTEQKPTGAQETKILEARDRFRRKGEAVHLARQILLSRAMSESISPVASDHSSIIDSSPTSDTIHPLIQAELRQALQSHHFVSSDHRTSDVVFNALVAALDGACTRRGSCDKTEFHLDVDLRLVLLSACHSVRSEGVSVGTIVSAPIMLFPASFDQSFKCVPLNLDLEWDLGSFDKNNNAIHTTDLWISVDPCQNPC